jgi:hypothetical protein
LNKYPKTTAVITGLFCSNEYIPYLLTLHGQVTIL